MATDRKKAKITYRGWPGHYILGHRCVFRLNTLIECGKKRVVVSTVGELLSREGSPGKVLCEPLGPTGGPGNGDRYYEIYVREARREHGWWEADFSRPVKFRGRRAFGKTEERQAQNAHYRVVAQIAKRLEREAERC